MDIIAQYDLVIDKTFKGLRITNEQVVDGINKLKVPYFNKEVIGYSENNKPIYKIKIGKGKITILLWSQMHGDESTATKSIFDLFNIVNNYKFTNVINNILEHCSLHFIPMLNPDGSNLYTRENFLGNDLNRDAKTLKNKESKILMNQVKSLNPDFAFNLHDQTSYYNVAGTENVATISLLAPAADLDRSITEPRKKAMSVIVRMNEVLQKYIPNSVGRYNDSYCESCFGDSIQSLGIPTILIESGYFPGDEEREYTRKLHTLILLEALKSIVENNFTYYKKYFLIPVNEKRFYDKRINNTLVGGNLTSVGVRYKYIFDNNKLIKIIDSEETIYGDDLEDKLFHNTIDANGVDFNILC